MGEWTGRRAVVTGAASGIGRAIATALAEEGCALHLCDLDQSGLDELAVGLRARGIEVHTALVDVSDPQAVTAWAEQVGACGPVNLVVNNAGIAAAGSFSQTPLASWRKVVDVNLLGVAHGCHAFLPHLRRAPGLRAIANLSSASAFGGTPGLAAYAATKAAVLSMSETLHVELELEGIQVHCVCPGFVRTNIVASTDLHMTHAEAARDRLLEDRFPESRAPSGVADALLVAVRRNRFLVPVYAEGHAGSWMRHFPDALRTWARRQMLRRMRALSERQAEPS